jgi:glycerol-3-phosphate acyltransferase PlsY
VAKGWLQPVGCFWALLFSLRYVSLASIMAGVGVVVSLLISMARSGTWDWVLLGFGLLVMVLVIVRHRSNIHRLWNGTEPKAGRKNQ